ncbi:hypothetical protein ACQPXB_08660 [Amycolatopsis sp. CA-161197]|uniref:hypothetical protein n=1 Tax=Amycolatopsis sp. CA-161197 TaxID=3239922 RepID=UPI003D91A3F3
MERMTGRLGQPSQDLEREVVLRALREFYCPLASSEISAFASVFMDVSGLQLNLSGLLEAERASWHSAESSDGLICPAIESESGFANARLVTSSDWPLNNRLVGWELEKSRAIWSLRVFCDLYLVAEEENLSRRGILIEHITERVQLLSEDLRGTFDFEGDVGLELERIEEVREAAEDAFDIERVSLGRHLETILPRLLSLPKEFQLFGAIEN